MSRCPLALLLAALVALSACSPRSEVPEVDLAAAAVGATAPDGVLVEGGWPEVAAYVRESAAAGKGTVVNLFASWCAPCERELPLLLETSARTPEVRWLGVASEDRRRDAEPFVARLEVTWPSVLDLEATTNVALESLAMPTTAFFDADGQLRAVVIGELDADRLERELARITP